MNQYFVPAIISLILAAIVCFIILPKMSPYILGGLSLIMLSLGIWQHYSMFPYEYKESMATDLLQQYSGFIMVFALILASLIGIFTIYGFDLPSVSDVIPEMPAMTNANQGPKNNSKGMFDFSGNNTKNVPANGANSGIMAAPIAAVTNAFNSAANAVSNIVSNNSKNNSKKNGISSPSFKIV